MTLSLSDFAKAIGAALPPQADPEMKISGLLTDSRDIFFPASTAFFALRTASGDGHRFIPALYDEGVRVFVVDAIVDAPAGAVILRVDSVLAALQRLGAYIRSARPDVKITAITGSRGKTVVKEQLYMQRKDTRKVARSPRSYNSQIGVPLSMWQIGPDTEEAIIEVGISHAGEMDSLERIVRPDEGIFTSITDEHARGFASLDEKIAEKARLFRHCRKIYYPAGDARIAEALRRAAPEAELVPSDFSADRAVSTRIDVADTLKNCHIVFDGFTNDYCSLPEALSFLKRRTSPGLTSTVILDRLVSGRETPSDVCARVARMLGRAGVSRLITVGWEESCLDALRAASLAPEAVADADEFIRRYSISDFDSEMILVKGDPDRGFDRIKSHLEAPRHETILEVNIDAIVHNYNYYRSLIRPETGLVAMVKAAGYGTGALELARTLQAQGAAYLAVAVVDEGVELRRAGITMPIMVMNPIGTNYKALFDSRLEPSVFSMRELDLLLDNAARYGITSYPVHIKLDTGMHRLGFLEDELPGLLDALAGQSHVKVASIFSHLATADCLDQDPYTEGQLEAFRRMSEKIASALPYPVKRHTLNTAGIMRYAAHQYDMVRLGIGLYGVTPIPEMKPRLRTVASLTTTIISIKTWPAGTTIGYGRRGVLGRESVIATIPIGYADGLDRHLSCGAASFMVNGKLCPVVGNICMDQCMIDVTGAEARIGDKVEIFGENIPVERLSDTLGTIPYEILTSISPRVKRIYYRE